MFGREITKHTVIYGVCINGSGQPYTCLISLTAHKHMLDHL